MRENKKSNQLGRTASETAGWGVGPSIPKGSAPEVCGHVTMRVLTKSSLSYKCFALFPRAIARNLVRTFGPIGCDIGQLVLSHITLHRSHPGIEGQ